MGCRNEGPPLRGSRALRKALAAVERHGLAAARRPSDRPEVAEPPPAPDRVAARAGPPAGAPGHAGRLARRDAPAGFRAATTRRA